MTSQPIIHCKYDELVDPKTLKAFDRNRNKHPPEEIEHLGILIEAHGMRSPITIAKAPWNCIAKGHGTTQAFIRKGWDKIPVVYQDFADYDSLYAYVQSDNAIQQTYAMLDLAGINTDLPEIGPFDIRLLGINGFVLEPADLYDPDDKQAKGTAGSYFLEVQFKEEEEMIKSYEGLLRQGFIVRVKY